MSLITIEKLSKDTFKSVAMFKPIAWNERRHIFDAYVKVTQVFERSYEEALSKTIGLFTKTYNACCEFLLEHKVVIFAEETKQDSLKFIVYIDGKSYDTWTGGDMEYAIETIYNGIKAYERKNK